MKKLSVDGPVESFIATACVVALLSCLAGGVSGKLIYGRWWRYAAVGLGNLLSILGFALIFASVGPPADHRGIQPGIRAICTALSLLIFGATYYLSTRLLIFIMRLPLTASAGV
ncbi:MAG: hypothetical protein ACYS8K_00870 [Planctomycetota bacterium]|jgi:hypothetical protein